jgi:hypothetical protein
MRADTLPSFAKPSIVMRKASACACKLSTWEAAEEVVAAAAAEEEATQSPAGGGSTFVTGQGCVTRMN